MSIYPIKVSKTYDNKKNAFYSERVLLKGIMPYLKCEQCKKSLKRHWSSVYVMHSITFGGPSEAWCNIKCLNKWKG